jgi:phosphoglycerate dehydrogenase-like enzyme
MLVWKNTSTLDGYDAEIVFTKNKSLAEIALLGSKNIHLYDFPKLKGIFRAGIGKDNVPENEASEKGIVIKYPSQETVDSIFNETAVFTSHLIFRMLYGYVGTLDPWYKYDRPELSNKTLLVIGTGNIGSRVVKYMLPFMDVLTFDILGDDISDLPILLNKADCVTLHIPKTDENNHFIDKDKLGMMKDGAILINTARGLIVDEDALFIEISTGRLRAAFDVFWQEPYIGKLKKFHPDKFYMSPHIAGYTDSFLLGCRKALDSLMSELSND